MDLSEISGQLVKPGNPARTDLPGMDYTRCAALHNFLMRYAWVAEGRPLSSFNISNFFTAHGPAAEAIRPRLHPSVAAFLDLALVPSLHQECPPLFFWVSRIINPEELFAEFAADIHDEPVDSILCLYWYNLEAGAQAGGGLFYDQRYHRAASFMHMDDHDCAMPIAAHPDLWFPLETVLSHWIDLIINGKITTSPPDVPSTSGSEKVGPWEWQPYSEAQVASCVEAWDRLCEAIETRRRVSCLPTTSPEENQPLLTTAALDAASVPENCFIRSFATHARRPPFRHIAPGILLPPFDPVEFAALQPYTSIPRSSETHIPPVCLFPAISGEYTMYLAKTPPSINPERFYNAFHFEGFQPYEYTHSLSLLPEHIPAGVYSEAVDRIYCADTAEEGFHFLLPFSLQGENWNFPSARREEEKGSGGGGGAKKSDGSFVKSGSAHELFQHGYKPFGGQQWRAQRLERLFEGWRRLVADGVWEVGRDGVQGGMETWKEADEQGRWRDYVLGVSW